MSRVLLGSEARATLQTAPPDIKRHLRTALEALARGGWTKAGLDVKQLRQHGPAPAVFRVRVGTWRIAFRIRGDVLEVVKVFPRRDGYGWMERLG